jgi:hypothetical protein
MYRIFASDRIKTLFLFFLFSYPAFGQPAGYVNRIGPVSALPGTCTQSNNAIVFLSSSNTPYYCSAANVWTSLTSGGGSGLVLLEEHTASSSASLQFVSSISASYDNYLITFVNLIPATSGDNLLIRFSANGGPPYDATVSNYFVMGNTTTSASLAALGALGSAGVEIAGSVSNSASAGGCSAEMHVQGLATSGLFKNFWASSSFFGTGGNTFWQTAGDYTTSAVNALQVLFASGNIASGTVRIYGYSH